MKHKCDGCKYKSEHQEMGFRPFGVCTRELNLIQAEKNYNADRCPYNLIDDKDVFFPNGFGWIQPLLKVHFKGEDSN